MVHVIRIGKAKIVRIISTALVFCSFSFTLLGQSPTCTVTNTTPTVHSEGLAEQIGDITFSCSGGAGAVSGLIIVKLNANVTNRLDNSGNLTGVTLAGAGVAGSPLTPSLLSPTSLLAGPVNFTAGSSISFTISGIRVALPTVTGQGSKPAVTGSLSASQLTIANQPQVLAVSQPTLLSSVLNYGIPCSGSPASPLPITVDFNALIAAGTTASTVRITEASPSAFVPKLGNADFGVRFLVSLAGYGPNAQVFVPDVIVGNLPASPTSAGAFNTMAAGGTYSPNNNQLLLTRVSGADATGAGGTLVQSAAPSGTQNFTSVTQLNLVNGAATVTYEVIASNNALTDSAQIPVFVLVPASTCPDSLQNTVSVNLAPASTVSVPTQNDPIPRYSAGVPASDCSLIGDCSAAYFPVLGVSQSALTFNGNLQGKTQSTGVNVANGGTTQMNFTTSISYQTAANLSVGSWLSASPAGGVVESNTFVAVILTADPTTLSVAGTYQATVAINAGSAGTISLPVTFTVGAAPPPPPPGPMIQSVVNSANLQPGPIAAGSFATIFGSNLAPKTTTPPAVTFSGLSAPVIYDGATQMNVVVPALLGSSATTASVVATIDGVASSGFTVSLVPNAPAVFNPGIENQDYSVNSPSGQASVAKGEIIQIFLTGLATPITLPITVNIGSTAVAGSQITYAGAVAGVPGLEQVNVRLPSSLAFTGGSAQLSVCVPGATAQLSICSAPVPVYLH